MKRTHQKKKERKKGKTGRKERGRSLVERRRSGSLNSFQCVAPGIIFSSWQFPWTCEQRAQLIVSAFFFFFLKTLSHRACRAVINRHQVSVKKYKMITPKVCTACLCLQRVFFFYVLNIFVVFLFFFHFCELSLEWDTRVTGFNIWRWHLTNSVSGARQDQRRTLSDILMIVLMTHLKFESVNRITWGTAEELILSPGAICKDL